MSTSETMPVTTPQDMSQSRQWFGQLFARPADLPISFVFDGKAMHGIPEHWQPTVTRRTIDANIRETFYQGTDPTTGLNVRVECTEYREVLYG